MGNIAFPFRVVTYPQSLFEGILPYGKFADTHAFVVGTWGESAILNMFDGVTGKDSTPAYRASITPTGKLTMLYPRGWFLDNLDQYDGGGTALGNGQIPPTVEIKPWGLPKFTLNEFYGQNNGQWNPQPLPQRVEVESMVIQTHGPLATWPTELRPVGVCPAAALAGPPEPEMVPSAIGPVFGLCGNWFYLRDDNFLRDRSKTEDFAGIRVYIEMYNAIMLDGKLHLGPSANADYDELATYLKSKGQFFIPAFNNNFHIHRQSFLDGGPDADRQDHLWHNGMTRLGADKMDPETWRPWGEAAFWIGARWGNVAWPESALNASTGTRFPGDVLHKALTAMGVIIMFTWGNEWIKFWQELSGHVTVEEAAVADAVIRHGYNNTMGPGVGYENADPSLMGCIGESYSPSSQNLVGMLHTSAKISGTKPDGTLNRPPKLYEVHEYLRNPAGRAVPFELSHLPQKLKNIRAVSQQYAPEMGVGMGEWGFTGHWEATGKDDNDVDVQGYSYFDAEHGYTAEERRASLTFMQGIFMAHYGVKYGCLYQDYDQAAPEVGVAWDKLCGYVDTLFHAWLKVFLPLLRDYVPVACSNPTLDPTQPYVFTCTVPGDASKETLLILYATGAAQLDVNLSTANGGELLEFDPAGGPAFLTTPIAPGLTPISAREYPKLVKIYS